MLSNETLYPWCRRDNAPPQPAAPTPIMAPVGAVKKKAWSCVEAAALIGISPSTLKSIVRRGEGPPAVRLPGGRLIRFPDAGLDNWLTELMTAGNTTTAGAATGAVKEEANDGSRN